MKDAKTIQLAYLDKVRNNRVNTTFVHELAGLLKTSVDSAYRRLRGEKIMTLDEILLISEHYKIPFATKEAQTGNIQFQGSFVNADTFDFAAYLNNVVQQVAYMNKFDGTRLYYLCKDIPLFHHFHFRALAAFKHYFWMKNILHIPEFEQKKFRLSDYPDTFFELGKKALNHYSHLHTIELWNLESINSTIRQVAFYQESNTFYAKEDIVEVYDAIVQTIDKLQVQAGEGFKRLENGEKGGRYEMYFNEIVILENSLMAEWDKGRIAYLVHNVLNVLMTTDPSFCEQMKDYLENLIRKSTLISRVSERERLIFFNQIRRQVEQQKAALA